MAAAPVVGGKVELPPVEKMRAEYEQRVNDKGFGRHFHSLKDREEIYVGDLLEWVNEGVVAKGHSSLPGHSDEWVRAKVEQRERMKGFFSQNSSDYSSTLSASTALQVCA